MEEPADYTQATAPVKHRLPPLLCPSCGLIEVPIVGPGTSTHAARALCRGCGRYLKWLPRRLLGLEKETAVMAGMARCLLVGTISKYGVAVRYATSGTACASFTVVVTEQGQDGREHPTLIPCECWGKKAEATSELEAGQLVLFEGKVAKRKKGEEWELIVSGFEVQALGPTAHLTGTP